MAFVSPLLQAGLSQVFPGPHQQGIQDWIWVFFSSWSVKSARSFSLLVQVKHTMHLGQGFMVIIPELEARSHLPNNLNSVPGAVTELPLSSGLSMTSEPGLSNCSQHPQSTYCKEISAWSSEGTLLFCKTLVSAPAQSRTGPTEIQSEHCYRTEFAFPSCSDWGTAECRDCQNSKLQATSCSA